MVEIKYRDQYEIADLAGHTVGEARERFSGEFGIPDKARAKLNGSKVKGSAEMETVLNDDDKLSFTASKGKGIYLVGALLLALAVTGGIFAWTATTDTVSLNLGQSGEYASIVDNASATTWDVFKAYKGVVAASPVFVITPSANYTGDLSATVMFANAHDMVKAYKVVMLELVVCDSTAEGGIDTASEITSVGYLSMAKGEVTFDIAQSGTTPPYHVYLKDGFYITHGSFGDGEEDVTLLCDVTQKGVMAP